MKRILFIDAGEPYEKIQERFYPLWPTYLASYVDKQLGTGEFKFHFKRMELILEVRVSNFVSMRSLAKSESRVIVMIILSKNKVQLEKIMSYK